MDFLAKGDTFYLANLERVNTPRHWIQHGIYICIFYLINSLWNQFTTLLLRFRGSLPVNAHDSDHNWHCRCSCRPPSEPSQRRTFLCDEVDFIQSEFLYIFEILPCAIDKYFPSWCALSWYHIVFVNWPQLADHLVCPWRQENQRHCADLWRHAVFPSSLRLLSLRSGQSTHTHAHTSTHTSKLLSPHPSDSFYRLLRLAKL